MKHRRMFVQALTRVALFSLLLPLAPLARAAVTNVAYWRFGENNSGAVNGATTTNTVNLVGGTLGIRTNATYTNAVSTTAASQVGSTLGLRFNSGNFGTNALVSTLTNNFGIELWARPDTNNFTQCLAYNGNSGGNGWGLYLLNSGQYVGLLGGVAFVGTATASNGVWAHLALVRDGGVATLYVNGVPSGTSAVNPGVPTGRFAVAVQPQTTNAEFFAGSLDEVRVFSFAPGGFSTNDLLFNNGLLVTTTNNSGTGSLRDVIAATAPGGTVRFVTNLSGQTITLTSEINLNKNLTITATNLAASVIISGGGTTRLFYINNNANITMNNLTLTGGNGVGAVNSGLGGAIHQFNGSLTMTRCTLSGSSATGVGDGGAIYSFGALSLNQCTLSGNSATNNGGAVFFSSTLTVVQSTITGNNSQIGSGGGIYQLAGDLFATNSIIAGNTASISPNVDAHFTSSASNLVDVLPLLAPLGNYGGPTQTRPPLPGSPAINAGKNSITNSLTTDQRGFPRLVGAQVDIGAVESGTAIPGFDYSVVTITNDVLNDGLGGVSLRSAAAYVPVNSTITFATNLAGQTITLTNEIIITKNLTITATNLPTNLVISGGGTTRLFYISNSPSITMNNLTLTGGNGFGAYDTNSGGAVLNYDGDLTLTRCSIVGNSAPGGDGGAIYNGSTLTLNQCTLVGNSALNHGGAILSDTTLTLNQCTLTNNFANDGGAFYMFGSVLVNQCTFSGNTAASQGGAIYCKIGDVQMTQSTFSGNSAYNGGAIYQFSGSINLLHCTVTENHAQVSGGIDIASTISATNTIIAGNTAPLYPNVYDVAAIFPSVSNLVNVLPQLAPLGNYGGPTLTRPPLLGSPAIDAGDNSVTNSLATDQRGLPRLVGARVDIGAVEGGVAAIAVTTTAATALGTTNATLNGTVNPGNLAGAAWFEWGTTTNYGSFTATNTLTAINATLAVSNTLSGLTAGVTYHYRLAASNALGVSYGTNVSFVTAPFQIVPSFSTPPIGVGNIMAWGDYNNDGWLDLLAPEGNLSSIPTPTVWRNTGGSFTTTGQTFPPIGGNNTGFAAWQDYDLDGRLDFIYLPLNGAVNLLLYRNTGTNFTDVTAAMLPVLNDSQGVAWGDYDNDGRPDLLYSGPNGTQLLRNTPGDFTPVSIPGLADLRTGYTAWADFDNDGWLDFAISCRQTNNDGLVQLWRNTGGSFSNVTASIAPGLPQVCGICQLRQIAIPNLAWGDYDNDGRLDLLVTGKTNAFGPASSVIAQLWRNTAAGFVQVPIPGLPGFLSGSPHWADYDNDGRLDFSVSGFTDPGGDVAQVWHNTGSGFEQTWSGPVVSVGSGSIADWGDFNNDGKLDLIIPFVNQLWQNATAVSNTPPSAPTGLTATLTSNGVVFAWNAATDAQTPATGLSYNVRAGTTPGGNDLVTGQVNPTNGNRRLPELGNAQMNRFFRLALDRVPLGQKIYWSVQAVDTAFAGGAFATESVFTNGFALVSVPGLPGGARAAWGDYDNDGLLDVFVTGGNGVSQLWRNTGNTFTNVPIAGLPALQASAVAWGDYDNDGRLDFVLLGSPDGSEENAVSQLWRNTGSGFTNVSATQLPGLPGLLSGAAAWGDFDNDGRLDLVVGGSYYDGVNYLAAAQLWRNTGTNFTNVTASRVPGLAGGPEGAFAWADYDGDGRLDLLAAGNGAAQLWRNTGSNFVNVTASAAPGLPGLFGAAMAWGDYDNDGRPDFILTGATNNSPLIPATQLWRNTGNGFTNVPGTGLTDVYAGGVQWGDYDADGRLDVLLNGSTSVGFIFTNQLWRNTSTGFVAVPFSGLLQIGAGHSAWADFDNDGRLDFLNLGSDGINYAAQLWRSLSFASNTPPTAPTGLLMTATTNAALLSWSAASDAQTPSSGLTYNVRAGTTPGGTNLLAAHVNPGNGFRRVAARGNAEQRAMLPLLGGTNAQTIYWSVQAVDNSFAGGPFASETSVVTIPTLKIASNATNAVVGWTPPTWGWRLQETPSLAPSTWSNAPSGESNPATIPGTNSAKFFRLKNQ